MKKKVSTALWIFGGSLATVALVADGFIINNLTYFDRNMAAVRRAGIL